MRCTGTGSTPTTKTCNLKVKCYWDQNGNHNLKCSKENTTCSDAVLKKVSLKLTGEYFVKTKGSYSSYDDKFKANSNRATNYSGYSDCSLTYFTSGSSSCSKDCYYACILNLSSTTIPYSAWYNDNELTHWDSSYGLAEGHGYILEEKLWEAAAGITGGQICYNSECSNTTYNAVSYGFNYYNAATFERTIYYQE